MVIKWFIFFILISSLNCRHLNRLNGFHSPGIDGTELNQQNYENVLSAADAAADNHHHQEEGEEEKIRERRNVDHLLRLNIENDKNYRPTEPSPTIETQQIHFEKEIKEAKAALYVIVGYISLTFVVVTAISCCALSLTVIIVSLIWSKKRTTRQPPPYFPPPPQWLPPPPEIYEIDSQINQNESQEMTN
uniref:Uncharacterized protein n=1 Tax=Panagrolaimus sp. ES5 TaxID=591445 RepID=A0AC34GFY2_9BILA